MRPLQSMWRCILPEVSTSLPRQVQADLKGANASTGFNVELWLSLTRQILESGGRSGAHAIVIKIDNNKSWQPHLRGLPEVRWLECDIWPLTQGKEGYRVLRLTF